MKKVLLAGLICSILLFSLAPVNVAEAKGGGGFFGPSFILSIVMSVALASIGVPPISSFISNFASNVGSVGLSAAIDAAISSVSQVASFAFENLVSGALDLTLNSALTAVIGGAVQSVALDSLSCAIGGCGSGGTSVQVGDAASTGVNLYVTASSLSQIEVGGGANLSGTITNNGSTAISGSFTNRFEIFNNSAIVNDSHDLAQTPIVATIDGGLAAGASVNVSATWNVPSTIAPGEYFLRLCANIGDTVSEADHGNNCGDLRAFTIVSSLSSVNLSDRAPLAIVEKSTQGGRLDVRSLFAPIAHAAGEGDLTSGTPSIFPAPRNTIELTACPAGYYYVSAVNYCIPDGYTTCVAVGYPNQVCPPGSFCRNDGTCESGSGGQNCLAGYNRACNSSANSCGMTGAGFGSCNGSCQAVKPADSSCPVPKITISTQPLFVNKGEACTVTWTTTDTTSCTLTDLSTGKTVASGLSGNYVVQHLMAQIDYKLHCQNGTVVSAEKNASCRINPAFKEN